MPSNQFITEVSVTPGPDKLKNLIALLAAEREARGAALAEKYSAEAYPILPERLASQRLVYRQLVAKASTLLEEAAQPTPSASDSAVPPPAGKRQHPRVKARYLLSDQSTAETLRLAREYCAEAKLDLAAAAFTLLIATRKSLEGVIAELERVVAENPKTIQWLEMLGDAYLRANRTAQAVAIYRQALALV